MLNRDRQRANYAVPFRSISFDSMPIAVKQNVTRGGHTESQI